MQSMNLKVFLNYVNGRNLKKCFGTLRFDVIFFSHSKSPFLRNKQKNSQSNKTYKSPPFPPNLNAEQKFFDVTRGKKNNIREKRLKRENWNKMRNLISIFNKNIFILDI